MALHPEPAVQLFSVRDLLGVDAAGALARLAALGWREVEPYGLADDPTGWRALLADAGLTAPSAHTAIVGEDVAAVARAAREADVGLLVDPSVDASRWETPASVRAFAEALAEAAGIAGRHGVRVGYHNHHEEIRRTFDGRTALELLARELDSLGSPVELQVDVYWAAAAGADPVDLVALLGERVTSLHVKDGPGRGADREQVALGRGGQPLRGILAAAPQARRIVELDTVAGDVVDDLAASLTWLREVAP